MFNMYLPFRNEYILMCSFISITSAIPSWNRWMIPGTINPMED